MTLLAMIVTAGLCLGAEPAGQEAAPEEADLAALRSLVQNASDSWGRGDGQAYAELFDDEADYVTFGGMHLKGRGQIARLHQQLFDGPLAGSRLALEIRSVRFLRSDIALMHVMGGIIEAGQAELTPARNSMQTLVVWKQDRAWRVTACQVTRIQPGPGGP